TLFLREGKVRLPAKTQVQRQPRVHSPVVLGKGAPLAPVEEQELTPALQKERRTAEQEISHVVSTQLVIERVELGLMIGVSDVNLDVHRFAAEMQFVSAPDVSEILPERPAGTIKVAQMTGINREAAPDRNAQLRRRGRCNLDSCIRKAERRGLKAIRQVVG